MRIRILLPGIVGLLALLLLLSAGLTAYDAVVRRREAARFVAINAIADQLLSAAGQWAIERGMTNASLHAEQPVATDQLETINGHRRADDEALHVAIETIQGVPEMKVVALIDDVESAFANFRQLRGSVDKARLKLRGERDDHVVDGLSPAITDLIARTRHLRLVLKTLTEAPESKTAGLAGLRHLAAEMAENAGRERAALGGITASRWRFSTEDIRTVWSLRGHVEVAWATIAAMRERPDLEAPLRVGDRGCGK